MVIVGIGTGIRRGDLFNLTWERIDIQRGLIYVPGCLKSTNRTWIGSVQGAVATWSNHQSPKSFGNIARRSLTRSLPLPVLTRSNNDFRLLRQSHSPL